MSDKYSRDLLKVSIGKILQVIGWHSINSSPLEILTDLLEKYLKELSTTVNLYANECKFSLF